MPRKPGKSSSVKKKKEKLDPPPAVPVVVPPGLSSVVLPPLTGEPPSLSSIRRFFRLKQEQLQFDPTLLEDIDNCLAVMEQKDVHFIIEQFHRLAGVIRYWRNFVRDDVVGGLKRQLERLDAGLDQQARTEILATTGKITEGNVKARITTDDAHQIVEDQIYAWRSIENQLGGLLEDLNVDVLVQDSVWARAKEGLVPVPAQGQSF